MNDIFPRLNDACFFGRNCQLLVVLSHLLSQKQSFFYVGLQFMEAVLQKLLLVFEFAWQNRFYLKPPLPWQDPHFVKSRAGVSRVMETSNLSVAS